jgi:nucleoside-diphosphate-sugar epimerase
MIAVTGANGLLGSFIVRKLIEEQASFIAIKRAGSDTSLLNDVQEKIHWRDADILDPLLLNEALEGCTHVIHSAAIVSFNPHKAKLIMEINARGTRNVVDSCILKNIKRLVHISSVAALSRQKEQVSINEENKWINNPLNSIYNESKYFSELEVFRGQEEGLSTLIINPSFILAPADWNRSSARLFKYVLGKNYFYMDGFLNYVDVRDVSSVVYQLLDSNIQAQRFIVNAGNISYKELFEKIALQINSKPPTLKISKDIAIFVAKLETLRSWFTGSEPLITRETALGSGSSFIYNNQKIRNILNFEFQPIDKTLAWCIEHYKKKMSSKK